MSITHGHGRSVDRELRALAQRCDTADVPTHDQIEDALERGFAALISLEALLQRVDWGELELEQRIASLRAALERLRGRATPEMSSSLAQGFVLPRDPRP